jgi:hypothetical protein
VDLLVDDLVNGGVLSGTRLPPSAGRITSARATLIDALGANVVRIASPNAAGALRCSQPVGRRSIEFSAANIRNPEHPRTPAPVREFADGRGAATFATSTRSPRQPRGA